MYYTTDLPVAASLIELGGDLRRKPVTQLVAFACYWAAFNNIYVRIGESAGLAVARRTDKRTGKPKSRMVGSIEVPIFSLPSEQELLSEALKQFPKELKHDLIMHASTEFFATREPEWFGEVPVDPLGQRLNGVLKMGFTANATQPVWAPIDVKMLAAYKQGDLSSRDELAEQILDLLYAVRNNTFHGGKSASSEGDGKVVEAAIPLLERILMSFVRPG